MYTFDGYSLAMIVVFILGYIGITLEHVININKATTALLMAILCWLIQFLNPSVDNHYNTESLIHHLASISQILFFLLGALTIVETISAHKGFSLISDVINLESKRSLLWVIGLLTFFLSAILDNLTTTIIMLSLLHRLVDSSEERLLIGGSIVIAANAGGAWSPIGDVTTTMLWIGGEIGTLTTMQNLFFPSLASMGAALAYLSINLRGVFPPRRLEAEDKVLEPKGSLVFFLGIGLLILVPIFKVLTGLPPFMGMLFALAILWAVTDFVHHGRESRSHLRVPHILSKIDLAGTLFFFLGILLCIDALNTAKILQGLASWLSTAVGHTDVIAVLIGLASAIVDNVPLVAAAMGMYSLSQYPQDHQFWQMIAYCAGTGGSILIIGSAAGVVYMSIEKATFFWYLKRISLPAAIGYAVGVAVYFLQ